MTDSAGLGAAGAAPIGWLDRMRTAFGGGPIGIAPPGGGLDGPTRVGVVDIGSNSVRLVIYEGAARAPMVYFNEKTLCGLGEELSRTGRLSASGRDRARAALARYLALGRSMGLTTIEAVGTAALREAEDGPAFAQELERRHGMTIKVATGADEARLAAQGVLFGEPSAAGVVADMGGASMELAQLRPPEAAPALSDDPAARIGTRLTTPLGPLRLMGAPKPERDAMIAEALSAAVAGEGRVLRRPRALFALGGSWRALARAQMLRTDHPLKVLQGYELPLEAAIEAADWVSNLGAEDLRAATDVSDRRAQVTPAAAAVLAGLLRVLEPEKLTISAYGLREGVLWQRLSASERAVDPLLAATAEIEAREGRSVGFGVALHRFIEPLFDPLDARQTRLLRAICLLADAAWRTHPDYRARTSFELATRGNFGGASHADRVFIGIALMYRHEGGKRAVRSEPATELLSAAALRNAEIAGRAARLGASFAAGVANALDGAELSAGERVVTLKLSGPATGLISETVERRLAALATAMKKSFEIMRD